VPASSRSRSSRPLVCLLLRALKGLLLLCFSTTAAQTQESAYISELFFNPPGQDSPHEYIEIRGIPNSRLPEGTFLIALEGDATGNPGVIQNLFDLGRRRIGPNGFLVLLQNTNGYTTHPFASVIAQTGAQPGWGHGSGSFVRHRGENSQPDMENASATFLLIETAFGPAVGQDVDTDDDGRIDEVVRTGWRILDSIGVLDADGAGDIAYGLTNFRRSTPPGVNASASGVIIPVPFTPSYVARRGNTTGIEARDWAAAEVAATGEGSSFLFPDPSRSFPRELASSPLNHIGSPNFGASTIPGIAVSDLKGTSPLAEDGGLASYSLSLTVGVTPAVRIELTAEEGLQISVDGRQSYASTVEASLSNPESPLEVWVRAIPNDIVQPAIVERSVDHKVLSESPDLYRDALLPSVKVEIADDDSLLLNEVLVNPVGSDEHREFVEIRGRPDSQLEDVWLVVIESAGERDPGVIRFLKDLDDVELDGDGLLLVASPEFNPLPPDADGFLPEPLMAATGGVLPNSSFSLLLIADSKDLELGEDLDQGNNGVLEGLSKDARILDSISWLSANTNDVAYGALLIQRTNSLPDAATRFRTDDRPNESLAWFHGDLRESDPASLRYDRSNSSRNTPPGATLTPGLLNNSVPLISRMEAICGAIGDPANPPVTFFVSDAESPIDQLNIAVESTNSVVAPVSAMRIQRLEGGAHRLTIQPMGVGYSQITVRVSDGSLSSEESFPYAASARGSDSVVFLIGAGDGSTAIPLPGGRLLLGDDENQVLRLYHRWESGLPLQRFPMTPFLGLTDIENNVPREVDIEGSTRVGDRLFWMGAHSHANIAEARTNRSRLFAVDLVDDGETVALNYRGRYDYLKQDLAAYDRANGHGLGIDHYGIHASTEPGVDPKQPEGLGFNLEGLSMASGSTSTAYLGARAPLGPASNRTHALLFPVLNFAQLAISDGPPGTARFAPPIELDLFNRGIRSIEGDGNRYLIIAGPPGPAPTNYPNDFRLYQWDGDPVSQPRLLTADLRGLNPEGIAELPPLPWTENTRVQIISDQGTVVWYGDDRISKQLPEQNFKKTRMDWIALGRVTEPQPWISRIDAVPGGVRLRWRSLRGSRYILQWSSRVGGAEWESVPGEILATGPWSERVHSTASRDHRYYRILALPNPP